MASPYRHIQLDSPRSIRVIHLEPSLDLQSPLFCSLSAINLDDCSDDDAVNYTALSYSWDAQNPCKEISCDGGLLLITPNCEAAMRRLRSPKASQQLWIDSICINQGEDAIEERNQQVALMGEVYKRAKLVVVWVGESDASTETAIAVIRDLGAGSEGVNDVSRRDFQRIVREKVEKLAREATRPIEDPITPLFERTWFHRCWTIQEATLCTPDKILLRCGGIEMPWINLVLATDALGNVKYRWSRWSEAMSLQKALTIYLLLHRYPQMKHILDDNPGDLHNAPLAFDILAKAREKRSSDPKDKVFALYSICKELEVPLPAPDYNKSVEEIYREAVIAAITYDKNLYVLYHVPSDNRRDGLASWVPDWSDAGWKPSDPRYALLRGRFAACGPSSSSWRFSADQRQLIVKGKLIDSIIYRTEPLPSADSLHTQLQNRQTGQDDFFRHIHSAASVLKTWVEVSQWSGDEYPTGERTADALQRTLVSDEPRNNADAVAGGAFESWYKFMTTEEPVNTQGAQPGQGSSILGAVRGAISGAISGLIPEHQKTFFRMRSFGAAFKYQTLVMPFSQKKCFFYTDNRYFGTAADPFPVPVEVGDRIAVVGGLGMPLLLRPVEGGYRLVTHIYVHGIMYGEAWPDNEDGLEDIVLI